MPIRLPNRKFSFASHSPIALTMDLTSLNSNLPNEGDKSSEEKLKEEFKNAATAVTKLYKTVSNHETQLKKEGYDQAIEEMLQLLDDDPKIDIYEWLLTKRNSSNNDESIQLGKRRRNNY